MRCKIKRGDTEGTIVINGEERRYKTYRIRIVYKWMGYSWNRKNRKEQSAVNI